MPPSDLARLRNLGPASAALLAEAGIHDEGQLRALGAVLAFKIVRHHVPGASLNLLYALEGALTGQTWHRLPEARRAELKAEADAPMDVSLVERPDGVAGERAKVEGPACSPSTCEPATCDGPRQRP